MRPTIKPVPPEAHLPGTASSKRRRGAGGARGKRAHLGGSEGLADGLSGEPRTGAGFSPRREPGGAEEEDGPLSLPSWLCGPPETSQAGSDPLPREPLSDSCEDGEALSSVHSTALAAGKLIHNLSALRAMVALTYIPNNSNTHT